MSERTLKAILDEMKQLCIYLELEIDRLEGGSKVKEQ